MANRLKIPLPGYMAPGVCATRNQWAGDYFGNNNYQAGGDKLYASDLGLTGIETIQVTGLSMSGNYAAQVLYPANNASNVNETVDPAFNSVIIKWVNPANGTEASNNANLSTDCFRLYARGV
jgi:hypothetical protein